MIQQFKSRQFLTFLISGGLAAAVNFGTRILYNLWVNFSLAIILAYITGMIVAFVLAKLFVFKDSQQTLCHSVMYFVLVNLLAVAQTWAISMALAYHVLLAIGIRSFIPEIAHAAGVVVPVFTSYLGHKHVSFRRGCGT
jgi:putative flippase GtrA